jgi:tetratricopeptide (TPR) repeat protein
MAVKKERSILEDSDAVAEKLESAEDFFKENQKWVYILLGAVVVIVGGFFLFNYYKKNQTELAQNELFRPIGYFESDSLNKALKGDGNAMGLTEIAEEYGMTKPGNLAEFYAGAAFLKQGKFQEAIDHLKDFSASDILVQARAYALTGDAYMELKNYDEAAKYYDKAAEYKPNKFYSPTYLSKAALAYEKKGDNETALKRYDEIIEKYFDSSEYNEARKSKSRLEAIVKK